MSLPEGITETVGNLDDNPVKFYNIPSGFVLFKGLPIELAKNYESQPNKIELARRGIGSYFFALPSDDKEYIESLENMYGVVYEYQTKREFQLLAMDDYDTVRVLYQMAPEDVQKILIQNYGYSLEATQLGSRASDRNGDAILENYLKTNINLGYAIFNMQTDSGGRFHPELFFCNITPGEITCNGMVTTKKRYGIVEENIRMRALGEQQRNDKKKRRFAQTPDSSNEENVLNFNLDLNHVHGSPVGKISYDSPVKKQAIGLSYDSPVSKISFSRGENEDRPQSVFNPFSSGDMFSSPPSTPSRGGKKKRTTKKRNNRNRKTSKRKERKSRTRK